jgi:hypothetical protein
MKSLILAIVTILAIPLAHAEDVIEANMQVGVANGNSSFSVFWSPSQKKGFVQAGLVWTAFDPAIHSAGFQFTPGLESGLVQPQLPEGCQLVSVKGALYGRPDAMNPLSLGLAGTCDSVVPELKQNDVILLVKMTATSTLRIHIKH